MSGQGEIGPGGGPAGDLYVEIVEKPHDFLLRDGNNLHISISVPMTAAALGTKVSIETLDGVSEVEVKSGFQSADTVVLRGLGMSRLRGSGRGDLIVHIEVATPQKLSKEEQELLRSFAELRGEKRDHVTIHQRGKSEHDHGFFSRFRDTFSR